MFQFQCPQGHLLEGDESQAGQTCQCPTCGMAFIIPAPVAAPQPAWNAPQVGPQFSTSPAGPHSAPVVDAPPALLHIPCPKGHELEVPPEMLNEEVMCPHCGSQFKLREKDSVEAKRKRQEEEQRKIDKSGKFWFQAAIVVAVGVVLLLVLLIAMQMGE